MPPVPHISRARTAKHPELPTDPRQWANVLAEIPLFADLSARHLRSVAAAGTIRRIHDGTVIIRQGDPGDKFFVVLDGNVSVRRRGRPTLSLGMGTFFGELSLLDSGPRTATVVADGPVVCLSIAQPAFLKLLRKEPAIAVAALKVVAARLRAAQANEL
jgi:CRP-like cAMP-binding protein